jgi:tetratricopeptide (TPR) repeat protein
MMRRFGGSRNNILIAQSNLANSYRMLGRFEEAMSVRRDVYSGWLELHGEQHPATLRAATNYANIFNIMQRHAETKELLRKTIPVARRALGEGDVSTLRMRWIYAIALHHDNDAPLDNLREAVATLESVANSWKCILGHAHPETPKVQAALEEAREALAERSAASAGSA